MKICWCTSKSFQTSQNHLLRYRERANAFWWWQHFFIISPTCVQKQKLQYMRKSILEEIMEVSRHELGCRLSVRALQADLIALVAVFEFLLPLFAIDQSPTQWPSLVGRLNCQIVHFFQHLGPSQVSTSISIRCEKSCISVSLPNYSSFTSAAPTLL